ncbi:hypothetical protein EYF80_040793 [Liparis tanakae]|uniref:Uncharacterized protein n=1 Tax=Liparis tanakae TaxID=230148 RepID=A0A4Z2G704_9TELE|nr:hypothetical protein EYF80_040793 [Liparis tanakae]
MEELEVDIMLRAIFYRRRTDRATSPRASAPSQSLNPGPDNRNPAHRVRRGPVEPDGALRFTMGHLCNIMATSVFPPRHTWR